MVQRFVRPDDTPPVDGYSNAATFTGSKVAVSGPVAADTRGA